IDLRERKEQPRVQLGTTDRGYQYHCRTATLPPDRSTVSSVRCAPSNDAPGVPQPYPRSPTEPNGSGLRGSHPKTTWCHGGTSKDQSVLRVIANPLSLVHGSNGPHDEPARGTTRRQPSEGGAREEGSVATGTRRRSPRRAIHNRPNRIRYPAAFVAGTGQDPRGREPRNANHVDRLRYPRRHPRQ